MISTSNNSWRGPMACDVKSLSLIAADHRRSRWLLLLLTSMANIAAQTPPAAAAAELASLSGAVTNSVTGSPVLRAHVSIRSAGGSEQQYGAMTNGEGKFTMTQLPPGHYTVSVEHTGFVMSRNRGGTSF